MALCALGAPRAAASQGSVSADIIVGTVTGPDGFPLAGAVVEAIAVGTQVLRRRTTDGGGRFTILLPDGGGRYQLVVRFADMAPVRLAVARHADEDLIVANVRMGPAAVAAVALEPATVRRRSELARGQRPRPAGTNAAAQSAPIFPNPISTILGLRDSLRLSADQVAQLQRTTDSVDAETRPGGDAEARALVQAALARARGVLTPYQWASLPDSVRTPGGGGPGRARQQAGTVAKPRSRTWSLYTSLSHVFDSNIDHAQDGPDSYGFLAGLGGRYRHRSSGGTVALTYDGVFRHYLRGDTWNRPGHEASLSVGQRVTRHWALGATGDVSINGSAEERVLRNEYSVGPELEWRLNQSNRLSLYGEYQLRRYPNPQGQNGVNQRVGLEFQQQLGEDRGWAVNGLYEFNRADSTRQRYVGWSAGANVANPAGPDGNISASVRYRVKRYTSRLVHLSDADVLRQDHELVATIMWERVLDRYWEMVLSYTYQIYQSNDARREFRDHLVGLTTKLRL